MIDISNFYMDFSKITVEDIYKSAMIPYLSIVSPAELWIEAENIMEIRAIVIEWYKALENGSAFKRFPDRKNKDVTMSQAKKMISNLDKDFMTESYRWEKLKVEAGPEFSRLPDCAQLAFAQQLKKTMKTSAEIATEATKRLLAGEILPKISVPAITFGD